jgi:hypothetical protein
MNSLATNFVPSAQSVYNRLVVLHISRLRAYQHGLVFHGVPAVRLGMAVNLQANLNLAILYSFTGRIEMAKEIVNNRWLLLYSRFVFAVWDSYRLTVKQNQLALLADRNEATVQPTSIRSWK